MVLAQLALVTSLAVGDYSNLGFVSPFYGVGAAVEYRAEAVELSVAGELGDVAPVSPASNETYRRVRDGKAEGNLLTRLAGGKASPNLMDVGFSELGSAVLLSGEHPFGMCDGAVAISTSGAEKTSNPCVLTILDLRRILKIRQTGVCLDPVLVVDFDLREWASAEKRFRYETMHGTSLGVSETDAEIPLGALAPLEHMNAAVSFPSEASDAPEARHIVAALPSDDGAPFFGREFFWGKVWGSHRGPPTQVPLVRVGVGVSAPLRPAYCTATGAA